MSKLARLVGSLGAILWMPLLAGAATVVSPSFPYVWVDADGKTVGAALRVANGEVVIELTTGRVLARVIHQDGNPTLRGEAGIYFATSNCTGSTYVRAIEPIHNAAGDIQLVTGRGGGLYSYDRTETPTVQTVGSWLSEAGCVAAAGSQLFYTATLEHADFLGQFTSPLHLELVSGPQLATVPALGSDWNIGLALGLMVLLVTLGRRRWGQAEARQA